MREYKNKATVDMVNTMIDSISPGLRLARFSLNSSEDTVVSADVVLPVKGNKKVIEDLEKIGFVKERMEMVHGSSMFEKDYFRIWLTVKLWEPPETRGYGPVNRCR